MLNEGIFWRRIALGLGLLLGLSVLANLSGAYEIPRQITLFLFGTLIALATGYSVVNPKSSLVRLGPLKEKAFRRRQLAVGVCVSAILGLLFLAKQVRETSLIWLFTPIIVMPVALFLRELIIGEAIGRRSVTNTARKKDVRKP